MTTALKRIEREPLWDLAHAQLRDALLAGRFEPGTVLTLRALAESFGTSITPVRDARHPPRGAGRAAAGTAQFGDRAEPDAQGTRRPDGGALRARRTRGAGSRAAAA